MYVPGPWPLLKGLFITLLFSQSVRAIDLVITDERASDPFVSCPLISGALLGVLVLVYADCSVTTE